MEGMQVTGIDISRRSIDYARTQAEKERLDIDYICTDFFDIEYEETFDVVLQVYGENLHFFRGKTRPSPEPYPQGIEG